MRSTLFDGNTGFSLKAVNYFFFFLLLFSVAAALYTSFEFHAPAEQGPREVEITVRYSDVEIFAARAGLTVEEALAFLKEKGVTSIGVAEYTLWRLRRDPGCYVLSNLELAGELSLNPALAPYRDFLESKSKDAGLSFGDYVVFMPEGPWAQQVWEHLKELSQVEQAGRFRLHRYVSGGMALFIIQGASYDNLPGLSLGANPAHLERVAEAGLLINPYLSRRKIESAATAEQMLSVYDGYLLSAVVFEGGEVPGYPLYTREMAAALKKRGLPAVLYEYNRFPKGLPQVAPLLDYNLVVMRPGSIGDPPDVPLNGIKERRVQMLELKIRDFAPQSSGEKLQKKLSLRLEALKEALEAAGYPPGKASCFYPRKFPVGLYLLMAAGLAALFLLFLQVFLKGSAALWLFFFILSLGATGFMLRTNAILTLQALSLMAALLFPLCCALLLFFFNGKKFKRRGLWGRIFLRLFLVFLLALAGGLLVHAFLTAPPFFHGLEMFRGVKAMYLLPVAAAGILAFALQGFYESSEKSAPAGSPPAFFSPGHYFGGGEHDKRPSFFAYLRRLLRRPLTLGDLLLAAMLLAAAFIYITRTGHVVEINPLEDLLRQTLEKLLGVRPRLKEFALGYPAAALGLYLFALSARKTLRRLAFFLLFAGTLAPVSVVNTFAHITAPVKLSLWRSLHGFWLGLLIAFVLIVLLETLARLFSGRKKTG